MNTPAQGRLLQFYGTECVHCHTMNPHVEKLESELRTTVHKLEVWHDEENAKLLASLDHGICGGIPFFFNEKTGKWICGTASYEKLKQWAVGQ